MNYSKYLNEGNSIITKLYEVNSDNSFSDVINDLSSKLESIGNDSTNIDLFYSSYLDKAISEYDSLIVDDIEHQASILYCASYIYKYGLISYQDCREMINFSDEDMVKLANILDESLVYDTLHFIATESFLANCSSIYPS